MNADEYTELRPAYEWTCDQCGRDFFTRCIVVEPENLSEEDLDYMAQVDADHPIDGFWVMAPLQVTCEICQKTYLTMQDY